MIEPIEVGKRIKERREELGLTQEQLGAQLWLNKSTIQRYETGKIKTIKLPVIQSIAECLSVNPDWIICKTNDKSINNEDGSLKELCGKETVIYNRDGRVIKTKLNEEQIKYLEKFIESLSGKNHDHL